jgi:hypothetical protein
MESCMFNNRDSGLNTKHVFNLPASYRRVGSMDRPMLWDDEMVVVVAHRTECTIAASSH